MFEVAQTQRCRLRPVQLWKCNYVEGFACEPIVAPGASPAPEALDLQLLVEVRRELLEEAARGEHHPAGPRAGRDLREAQVELVAGPGHGHVEQAPLLLDVPRLDG